MYVICVPHNDLYELTQVRSSVAKILFIDVCFCQNITVCGDY